MDDGFVRIASLAEVPDGEMRAYDLVAGRIALAHVENELFAFGDECTHEGCSLAEGALGAQEDTVVCPCHESEFDLATGEPVKGPAGSDSSGCGASPSTADSSAALSRPQTSMSEPVGRLVPASLSIAPEPTELPPSPQDAMSSATTATAIASLCAIGTMILLATDAFPAATTEQQARKRRSHLPRRRWSSLSSLP